MQPHDIPKPPTVNKICQEFDTGVDNLPPTELIQITRYGCNHNDILASKLKFFFIKYTPNTPCANVGT